MLLLFDLLGGRGATGRDGGRVEPHLWGLQTPALAHGGHGVEGLDLGGALVDEGAAASAGVLGGVGQLMGQQGRVLDAVAAVDGRIEVDGAVVVQARGSVRPDARRGVLVDVNPQPVGVEAELGRQHIEPARGPQRP